LTFEYDLNAYSFRWPRNERFEIMSIIVIDGEPVAVIRQGHHTVVTALIYCHTFAG